jgi:glycosyltransferase involved in cell wall biosynthesis
VKRWWRRRKFSLIVGRADRIVVVSPHLLTSPALASAALAKRAIVIPNGVDLAEVGERGAAPCAHPWLADRQPPPVILAVGRLVEQKNFGTLVQAFAMARQSAPLRLLIIGDGPERERLLRRAAELGIGGEMAILPHTANPISCMARSAVLALPSWREGSSNVLLEALAVGLPVVASRTAGSAPDVLDGGRFGLLVDPHDPAALAAAILRQIGPDAIAPGARAADYSREVSLQKYVEVITSLCQSAGAGRGEH